MAKFKNPDLRSNRIDQIVHWRFPLLRFAEGGKMVGESRQRILREADALRAELNAKADIRWMAASKAMCAILRKRLTTARQTP